jgi:hypothetical protein
MSLANTKLQFNCPARRRLGAFRLHHGDERTPSVGASIGQRDLTPEEKQVIMDAVAPVPRNPASAKCHWATFPAVVTEGSVNYARP